ncbi:hypothetical protein [Fibrella aquatilis]|uniref:DUF4276 family protein n=1 Tax=Fibrella aquatilis TaxID=2817059 RepID=A0A939GBY0_9BACT|nr:hypothetical protein [Fibrella aquatilis]MBO0934035.1 hypothetical protein [Fibrella aquatilis]
MKRPTRLDYTLVAEGYAEYTFIPIYLRIMAERQGIQLVRSKLGFKGGDAGKTRVLKEVSSIFTSALTSGNQLLIAGVDLDTADHDKNQPKHEEQCRTLINSFGKTINGKAAILHFVPVQAIEQWIAYQAYRAIRSDQYSANSLERISQKELKKLLYKGRSDGAAMELIAEKIALVADYDELANQSRSFEHFHNQVRSFLETFAASN